MRAVRSRDARGGAYTRCLFLAFNAGLIGFAAGADVLWQAPQPVTGPGDLIAEGTVVAAVNEGSASPVIDPAGLNLAFSPGNDFPGGGVNAGLLGSIDEGFDTLLDEADTSPTTANPHSFAIGGLTPGQHYSIQFFVSDLRSCCHRRSMEITGGSNTTTVYMGDQGGIPVPPQNVRGTFIADGPSQSFSFRGTHPTDPALRYPQLNAYVLREIDLPDPPADQVFISEFLTAGNETDEDEDGDTPDWIEICNPTGAPVGLAGHFLTDDPLQLTKWRFPDVTVAAGDYLVVFASGKDRLGTPLHTNFALTSAGEYLALVAPDGITILHQYAPSYPPQEPGYSYGIDGNSPAAGEAYFAAPTPGSPNGQGIAAPLAPPGFSVKCATFTDSIRVALRTVFPGGIIRYTTNGTVPTGASTQYTRALTIRDTTRLRARVFDPLTGDGGETDTGFYTKLATTSDLGGVSAPSAFSSTMPILVLENFNTGGIAGPGSSLKYTQISVFETDPVTGRASLANLPDDCLHAGLRIRGSSSSGFAKKQYRVEIWNEDSQPRNVSLLGMPRENDWVLGAPYVDEALMRNPLIFALGRDMGIAASRTRYCEVFLNTGGGPLQASDYQGVYYVAESIKIDNNRVNVTPHDSLVPGDSDGGYIIRHEAGPANKTRITGWNYLEIHDPEPVTNAQRDFISDFVNDLDSVLRTPRWNHPTHGYKRYIDEPSWIDTLVINEFARELDSYVRSAYLYKDRDGKLVNGPLWDYNYSFGISCCFNSHLTGIDPATGSGWQWDHAFNRGSDENGLSRDSHGSTMARLDWYRLILRDPDFMQLFIDRYGELRSPGNLLDTSVFHARIDEFAAILDGNGGSDSPQKRNFLRWRTLGSQQTGFQDGLPADLKNSNESWEAHVQFLKDWSVDRFAWMDSQFLARPVLIPGPTARSSAFDVTVAGPELVYYTTDGSDPRLPGGGISPNARVLAPSGGGNAEATFIARGASWAYLDDGSDLGSSSIIAPAYDAGNWKHPDFNDGAWQSGPAVLGFGDLGAGGSLPVSTAVSTLPADDPPRTYYFRKSFHVDDASPVDSLACEIMRDDGAIVYLNGREILRSNLPGGALGHRDFATDSIGRDNEPVYHQFALDRADLVDGENILAVELHQATQFSDDLGFDLSLSAIVVPPGAPTIPITETTRVRTRSRNANGDWSAPSDAIYVVGAPADASNTILSEMNYHPPGPTPAEQLTDPSWNDDDFEWLELKNISADTIDLSGVAFTDGIEFAFPLGFTLPPGGYAVLVENQSAFARRHGPGRPVAGVYTNKLDNGGETLRLRANDGSDIFRFTFDDSWYRPTDGDGYTLVTVNENSVPARPDLPAAWGISGELLGTPGAPNGELSHTFEGWLHYHFTAAEQADPSISGADADLDLDNLVTLMEFALGLDPRSADRSAALPTSALIDDGGQTYLALSFRRQKKALDLTYRAEFSSDLLTWTETAIVVGTPVDNGDGTETVTIRSPIAPGTKGFMRLAAEKIPWTP